MNKPYLRRNVGKLLLIRPEPWHVNSAGGRRDITDGWRLEAYSEDFLVLRHVATDSELLLSDDNVLDYRADAKHDGTLLLKAQIVIGDGEPRVIPKTHFDERITLQASSLLQEVYLDVSLDCHEWKNAYVHLSTWDEIDRVNEKPYRDTWDALVDMVPAFDAEAYQRFRPLFLEHLVRVRTRFDRAIQLFGHILPHDFQAKLLRSSRQLGVEQSAYLSLNRLFAESEPLDQTTIFQGRFRGAIRAVATIDRELNRLTAEL